jgi:hypothetical protein
MDGGLVRLPTVRSKLSTVHTHRSCCITVQGRNIGICKRHFYSLQMDHVWVTSQQTRIHHTVAAHTLSASAVIDALLIFTVRL